MARDADFIAAATAAAQALTTARNALQIAQAAATREFAAPDLAPLIDGIVRAMQGLQLPAPDVTVQAGAAPLVTVEAAQITVQPAAPAVNNFAPNVVVDVQPADAPTINVEAPVVNIEPTVVNVAAPSVRVDVPAPVPLPRLPWRMDVHRDPRTSLITWAEIVPVEPFQAAA
jgi:hypothetical protein